MEDLSRSRSSAAARSTRRTSVSSPCWPGWTSPHQARWMADEAKETGLPARWGGRRWGARL